MALKVVFCSSKMASCYSHSKVWCLEINVLLPSLVLGDNVVLPSLLPGDNVVLPSQ